MTARRSASLAGGANVGMGVGDAAGSSGVVGVGLGVAVGSGGVVGVGLGVAVGSGEGAAAPLHATINRSIAATARYLLMLHLPKRGIPSLTAPAIVG